MILITCVDDNGGMMFNHRRQSQDRVLRGKIIELTKGKKLLMNDYSSKQFTEECCKMVCEEPLERAAPGEYVFVENIPISSYSDKIEQVVLYRWNKVYPKDMTFDLSLEGFLLEKSTDYKGSSHDKITEEIYVRK